MSPSLPRRAPLAALSLSLSLSLGLSALALTATPTAAQTWPAQQIRIVIPFPPGQASDVYMRLLAERLTPRLGHPVIVDNRPGAGGAIGMQYVVTQKPDGYTILMGGSGSMAINPTLNPSTIKYDPLKDFEPIGVPVAVAQAFIVAPGSPIKTIGDLIAAAKAKPGTVSYASSGPGTTQHLFVEQFAAGAGVRLLHVPYKGSAPALTDLMGGQVVFMSDTTTAVLPHVQSGKARAIGVTSTARSPLMPEVPTIAEAGVRGYEAVGWVSVLAPAGTPAAIADRLHNEINAIMAEHDTKKKVIDMGFIELNIPRNKVRDFFASELAKWKKVIVDAQVPIS